VYKDLENKTVDVGGWGDVKKRTKSLKIVQNVLIKLKINLLDYSVLSNKYLDFIKKQHSVKTVAFFVKLFCSTLIIN
jgi:hypothetical protein